MGRPKSPHLIEHVDDKFIGTQVREASGVFAVTYGDSIITVRSANKLTDEPPRYKQTIFPTSGSAHLMANKLNQQFGTAMFGVFDVAAGKPHIKGK